MVEDAVLCLSAVILFLLAVSIVLLLVVAGLSRRCDWLETNLRSLTEHHNQLSAYVSNIPSAILPPQVLDGDEWKYGIRPDDEDDEDDND